MSTFYGLAVPSSCRRSRQLYATSIVTVVGAVHYIAFMAYRQWTMEKIVENTASPTVSGIISRERFKRG